jgi:hypothetical protein
MLFYFLVRCVTPVFFSQTIIFTKINYTVYIAQNKKGVDVGKTKNLYNGLLPK